MLAVQSTEPLPRFGQLPSGAAPSSPPFWTYAAPGSLESRPLAVPSAAKADVTPKAATATRTASNPSAAGRPNLERGLLLFASLIGLTSFRSSLSITRSMESEAPKRALIGD